MSSQTDPPSVSLKDLWRQFLPLSLSDVTMMASDPIVTSTLAHLPDARLNLAAVGVAKSIAVFFESPVIMLLHTSNALADSLASRRAVWRFMLLSIGVLTAAMAVLAVPAVFESGPARFFGVEAQMSDRAVAVLGLMILWPAAIGWRRYFQGLLIHAGHAGAVGRCGLIRVAFVATVAVCGFQWRLSGSTLAGLALAGGVLVEAVAVTLAARWKGLREDVPDQRDDLPDDVAGVWRFYRPLASSMLLVWGARALLLAIVARATDGPLALAAWPAAWSVVLVVANATRMVQQVIIRNRTVVPDRRLWQFAASVGASFTGILVVVSATPIGAGVVEAFVGSDAELVARVLPVILACSLVPMLVAIQNAAQGFLIGAGRTGSVNAATCVGVAALLLISVIGCGAGVPGALAAGISMTGALIVEVAVLAKSVTD